VFFCLPLDLISELVGVLWVQRFGSFVAAVRPFRFRPFKFPCSFGGSAVICSSVPEDPWTCTSDFLCRRSWDEAAPLLAASSANRKLLSRVRIERSDAH
jgi:hypothetical protein